jgi:hypothetical protein
MAGNAPEGTAEPTRPAGGPAALLVECTVCHVAGVVEAQASESPTLRAGWQALACVFTDGCPGHVWPEMPN